MATYTVRYDIATALVSGDMPELDDTELDKFNKWLEFHELADANFESTYEDNFDNAENYPNEGFYSHCEIAGDFCNCDEIRLAEH